MSNRKDTCPGKECPLWKRYGEHCPNYVKGEWRTNDGHEYTTHDCAPKRSMILCQQIYDNMVNVRKDYNQVRNANEQVLGAVLTNLQSPDTMTIIDLPGADIKLLKE